MAKIKSVAVYCASSSQVRPSFFQEAYRLGECIAENGIRLVYGDGGIGLMGKLAEGAPADITILDLDKEWTVDSDKFYTVGKVTPFEGKKCKGKAVATVVAGKIVMKDGELCGK